MGSLIQPETEKWYLTDRFPCGWTRVDLQPRDLRLLRLLFEQKFLSRSQIKNHIFDGRERYTYVRLWKLRRFGFVRHSLTGFYKEALYFPTDLAHEFFRGRFVELPLPIDLPDIRTLYHDLLVTDVRFLFEKMGFGRSWTSERVWRMGRSVRLWAPDAVIEIGGDLFALEVECIQKMDRRYEEIFYRYGTDPEISSCLYVTTESLVEALMKRAQNYSRIYFTTLKELFEKKEKTVFKNAKGDSLEIEENLERNLNKVSAHGD